MEYGLIPAGRGAAISELAAFGVSIMRIGLVGSWKTENIQSWDLSNESGFFEASRIIGTEIARKNHQIVVGSESKRTVDYHAVGVLSSSYNPTTSAERYTPAVRCSKVNQRLAPLSDQICSASAVSSSLQPRSCWR